MDYRLSKPKPPRTIVYLAHSSYGISGCYDRVKLALAVFSFQYVSPAQAAILLHGIIGLDT